MRRWDANYPYLDVVSSRGAAEKKTLQAPPCLSLAVIPVPCPAGPPSCIRKGQMIVLYCIMGIRVCINKASWDWGAGQSSSSAHLSWYIVLCSSRWMLGPLEEESEKSRHLSPGWTFKDLPGSSLHGFWGRLTDGARKKAWRVVAPARSMIVGIACRCDPSGNHRRTEACDK